MRVVIAIALYMLLECLIDYAIRQMQSPDESKYSKELKHTTSDHRVRGVPDTPRPLGMVGTIGILLSILIPILTIGLLIWISR